MSADAIRFRGLTLGYDRHPAIHHLDGTVPSGACLALVGPNGAGKSTLLKGIVGEIRPFDGQIERETVGGAVAYLPQATEVDRSFPIGVLDLVAMGLWRRSGLWRSLNRERKTLGAALAAVGLSGFERRPIGTLSGGQLQRALFARLMVQDARIVLLDEPFKGVDARTVEDLLAIVRIWHGEGRTVVAALHDLGQVRAHFPTTLLLAREAIAWGPTEVVLTPRNLAQARSLSEAWDEEAEICRRDHDHEDAAPGSHGHDHADHGHDHAHRHEAAE